MTGLTLSAFFYFHAGYCDQPVLLDHKEMQDLDPADRETVRERDARRLQVMERYCYTTECLRQLYFKVFRGKSGKTMSGLRQLLREFETLDMTEAAKKVINCVYEAKGRYEGRSSLTLLPELRRRGWRK